MTVTVTFKANRSGIRQIARSPEVLRLLEKRADRVRDAAVALAPVESGTYKRSFKTYSFLTQYGGFQRGMATVVNEAPYAAAVEFGNARRRGEHVLARALAGLAVTS